MKKLLLGLLLGLSFASPAAEHGSNWVREFLHPPSSARPWVYWFWLNGNVTSNGITADLEAMKRVGIGGVLIMEVDQGAPKGPADFGGGRWRELFKHVCAEANRLGLEVNMNNDAGWCGSGGPWITPDLAMQKIVWSETNLTGPCQFDTKLPQPSTVSNYYRDITVLAFPTPKGSARISDIEGKAAFSPKLIPIVPSVSSVSSEETIESDRILELSFCLDTNANFHWAAPAGNWTILRLGHTPTGADNHPAPEPGRGLESDKLCRQATEAMFKGLMGKLIADSPRLAGKSLVSTHIDSWETGSQNWTPRFREEFQSRRGYDPLRWLPVITGRIIGNREMSERFLWDLRQTVSELLVQNYAGHFRRLAHEQGLRLSIEAYDGTPCDDLSYAGQADEPMAEFWSWGANTAYSCLEMSSAAHVYGKRILGAEAFTANDQEKWLSHPAAIKTLGDWAFCEGINRFVFHRYALQPWRDRAPGMSMGPWGLHYERTQTWWEYSAGWHEYLARCQYLLRQGVFVADICFLEPEGSPMRFAPTMPWRSGNTPERPRYNFDGCPPDVVLNRMRVKDGKLVVADGPSYEVLVLPQIETMTPGLLRRVKELVDQGATVIGLPPQKSPSLANYPNCDREVQRLAAELWAGAAGSQASTRRVIWSDSFKSPQPSVDLRSTIEKAQWIWHREGNPATAAPPGKRYFRRSLVLSPENSVEFARLRLTVDNQFELWVNGKLAGSGDNFKHIYDFDVKSLLNPGTNLLAIAGENTTDYPNPAGAIGALQIKFRDGTTLEIETDRQWQTSTNAPPDWNIAISTPIEWTPAMELGALGMEPWGELDTFSGPPYVYPEFTAIANVLKTKGVSPDFEADPRLRFIHRQEGSTDIYFIANSTPNWLQANCAFRVSGKQPELWDPQRGHVMLDSVFEEKQGRTFLPLSFEPAGSSFVVFRKSVAKSGSAAIIAVNCDGRDWLPEPTTALAEPPRVEIVADQNNRAQLLAWQSGRYEIKRRSGSTRICEVPALPASAPIDGPWDVEFQQRPGPKRMTFGALMDWSQHTNPLVKCFSGTAVYRKTFAAPDEVFAKDQRIFLDLGQVAVMAHVRLNDRDLGTLWKPPYRVEVTGMLHSGENRLEVKVVNLWINRMIGDERLPEDSDRNPDGTLKQWPQWLLDDLPSPTGRSTFTTWRLWKKDSSLAPSGLMGPVKLTVAKTVSLR